MTTTTAKRVTNAVVLLATMGLLLLLAWGWFVPPASATTPGDVDDLAACSATVDRLSALGFVLRVDLDEATRALALVDGERQRLDDEVDRLTRQVDRQARTIARLRAKVAGR